MAQATTTGAARRFHSWVAALLRACAEPRLVGRRRLSAAAPIVLQLAREMLG